MILLSTGALQADEPPKAVLEEIIPKDNGGSSPLLLEVPPKANVVHVNIKEVNKSSNKDEKGNKPPAPVRDKQGKLVWTDDLDAAHRKAQELGKPVFVSVTASWCPSCQAMKKTFLENQVQDELTNWVLVRVDVTSDMTNLAELQAGGVPALFVRTASGRPIAASVGRLSAEKLIEWLKQHHEAALARPDDVLLAPGTPDAQTVTALVGQFGDRDPAVRQAAIRQLIPWPDASCLAVVKAFSTGRLSTKLSAIEVLRRWDAPIDQMDPWRPETFGREALARLDEWAAELSKSDATTDDNNDDNNKKNASAEPKPLGKEQLAEARVELDRLIKGNDAEARATAERLATFGPALLDEVAKRIDQAETDHDLHRLRMLRYRLLASDSLVLRWPGGLSRLADADPRLRQKAAEHLVKRTKTADTRLLLALCGDADPMVREIALRGLQAVGGDEATGAMAKMLNDPEPNVRAAVLKRLEEKPQGAMVDKVAKYLETEKDPDLIVHAVRFLRVSKNKAAINSLLSLLKHDVWQVRAEAAVALGEVADDLSGEVKAKGYAALIELLKDDDAFVVSRAVEGLSGQDLPAAAGPLIEAAQRHPNLAPSIIAAVARRSKMRAAAMPKLRKMLKHKDPLVRTAAIEGLAKSESTNMDKEMIAALSDPSREVRIAAAGWLFGMLEKNREATYKQINAQRRAGNEIRMRRAVITPTRKTTLMESLAKMTAVLVQNKEAEKKDENKTSDKQKKDPPADSDKKPVAKKPAEEKTKEKAKEKPKEKKEQNPYDTWLAECYAGKHRPAWADKAQGPLQKMAESDNPVEKMAAVMVLIPLGQIDQGSPVVLELLEADSDLRESAIKTLPWLVWKERLRLFNTLLDTANGQQDYYGLLNGLMEMPDRRTTGLIWNLLGKKETPNELAAMLQHGLRKAYLGERYYSPSDADPKDRLAMKRDAKHWAATGNDKQRITGLSLLGSVAPDEAAKIAKPMLDDKSLAVGRRRDVFRMLLVALNNKSEKKATKLATDKIINDEALRQIALTYLAGDLNSLRTSEDGYTLSFSITYHGSYYSGKPIIPKVPKGIKPEHVRPFLDDKDPKTAAYAGYLMALMRKPEGLPPLIAYWKTLERRDWDENRLVVRAVAALNDAKYVETLRKIYKETDNWRQRELYWTIRIMTGPEILKLRKQIRDEVGMNNLR